MSHMCSYNVKNPKLSFQVKKRPGIFPLVCLPGLAEIFEGFKYNVCLEKGSDQRDQGIIYIYYLYIKKQLFKNPFRGTPHILP